MFELRWRTLRLLVFFSKVHLKLHLRHANANVTPMVILKPGVLKISPTYLQMLGHYRKPFGIPDKENLLSMQAIFNHIYQLLQEYMGQWPSHH